MANNTVISLELFCKCFDEAYYALSDAEQIPNIPKTKDDEYVKTFTDMITVNVLRSALFLFYRTKILSKGAHPEVTETFKIKASDLLEAIRSDEIINYIDIGLTARIVSMMRDSVKNFNDEIINNATYTSDLNLYNTILKFATKEKIKSVLEAAGNILENSIESADPRDIEVFDNIIRYTRYLFKSGNLPEGESKILQGIMSQDVLEEEWEPDPRDNLMLCLREFDNGSYWNELNSITIQLSDLKSELITYEKCQKKLSSCERKLEKFMEQISSLKQSLQDIQSDAKQAREDLESSLETIASEKETPLGRFPFNLRKSSNTPTQLQDFGCSMVLDHINTQCTTILAKISDKPDDKLVSASSDQRTSPRKTSGSISLIARDYDEEEEWENNIYDKKAQYFKKTNEI